MHPGPCGVHLPAQGHLRQTCSQLSPLWGDLQSGGPQEAGAMVRRGSTRSADTEAQYSVPLCQEQLPDMNPIWHRVLTVVTYLATQLQIRFSANRIPPQVAQRKVSQVPQARKYLILTYQVS